jgi:hypothetical protein
VLAARSDWVQVQFDDQSAWLRRADVSVGEGVVKRATASSGLRVRTGPGVQYRSIGTLDEGDLIADQGGHALWRKISFGGRTGWVGARFLRDHEAPSGPGITNVLADAVGTDPPPSSNGGSTSSGSTTTAASTPASAPASTPVSEPSSGPTSRGMAYDNGRKIGMIDLVKIDGKSVAVRTAAAFKRMRAAAEHDGIHLHINSGFRTYDEQAHLYRLYKQHRGNLAAPPGYSNHEDGRALDIDTTSQSGTYRWLTRNAARFGFRRTVPSERWHWEYRP